MKNGKFKKLLGALITALALTTAIGCFGNSGNGGNGGNQSSTQSSKESSSSVVESSSAEQNESSSGEKKHYLSISNKPQEAVKLSIGTLTLTLEGDYPMGAKLVWSSSNQSVATVENGVVTLVGGGLTKISVKAEGTLFSDSFTLTVENDIPVLATGISFTQKPTGSVAYDVGELYLDYTLAPMDAEEEEVKFTSSNTAVATVDENGVISVAEAGETTIRVALVRDESIFDEFVLVVDEWKDIQLEKDDGTFEGVEGNVSVYSPIAEEITAEVKWTKDTVLTKTDSGELKITAVGEHEWSMVFVKFDTPIKAGKTYAVSLDANWLGDENASSFLYSIDVGENQTQMIEYTEIAKEQLFKAGAEIMFTATQDAEAFYLRLINNANQAFHFTLDNVSVEEKIIDYAFDEVVSVHTPQSNEIKAEVTWAKKAEFFETEDGELKITAEGEHEWSMVFVKFATQVKAGKTYKITLDSKWLGDEEASLFYYSIDVGENQTQMVEYTEIAKEDLFKEGASIYFVATQDSESVYLRLVNNSNNAFNFTLDNVQIEMVEATGISFTNAPESLPYNAEDFALTYALTPADAGVEAVTFTSSNTAVATVDENGVISVVEAGETTIRVALVRDESIFDEFVLTVDEWKDIQLEKDDGTFEGVEGNVSVYSPKAESITADVKWVKDLTLTKTDNGELKITAEGEHEWSMVFVKFTAPIKAGWTYNIGFDANWLGEESANAFYYSIDVGENQTQMVPYTEIAKADLFKVGAKLSFVATQDSEYVYLRLLNNANYALNFTLDNISMALDTSVGITSPSYALSENVTLLSNLGTEIANGDAAWEYANDTKITAYPDNRVEVTSTGASGRNYFFIKFATPIENGKTYEITLDGAWLAESDPYNLHYSIDVGETQAQSVLGYTAIAKDALFAENGKITFTANGDYGYFYLRIITDSLDGYASHFHFSIANVSVTEAV